MRKLILLSTLCLVVAISHGQGVRIAFGGTTGLDTANTPNYLRTTKQLVLPSYVGLDTNVIATAPGTPNSIPISKSTIQGWSNQIGFLKPGDSSVYFFTPRQEDSLINMHVVGSISELTSYDGAANFLYYNDTLAGGWFFKSTFGTVDSGTTFNAIGGGYWIREIGDLVKPEWWGAKGDSVTDDFLAFGHAKQYNERVGKTLWLSRNYYIGSAFSNPNFGFNKMNTTKSVIVDGPGSLTFQTQNSLFGIINAKSFTVRNISVYNCAQFISRRTETTRFHDVRAENVTVDGATYFLNVAELSGSAAYNVYVVNCTIKNTTTFTVLVSADTVSNIQINNNHLTNVQSIGIRVGRGLALTQDYSTGVIVDGNVIDTVKQTSGNSYGILVQGCNAPIISNNYINWIERNTGNCSGIYTKNKFQVITGNIIRNGGGDEAAIAMKGVPLNSTINDQEGVNAKSYNNIVSNNQIYFDSSYLVGQTKAVGIAIKGERAKIFNNILYNNSRAIDISSCLNSVSTDTTYGEIDIYSNTITRLWGNSAFHFTNKPQTTNVAFNTIYDSYDRLGNITAAYAIWFDSPDRAWNITIDHNKIINWYPTLTTLSRFLFFTVNQTNVNNVIIRSNVADTIGSLFYLNKGSISGTPVINNLVDQDNIATNLTDRYSSVASLSLANMNAVYQGRLYTAAQKGITIIDSTGTNKFQVGSDSLRMLQTKIFLSTSIPDAAGNILTVNASTGFVGIRTTAEMVADLKVVSSSILQGAASVSTSPDLNAFSTNQSLSISTALSTSTNRPSGFTSGIHFNMPRTTTSGAQMLIDINNDDYFIYRNWANSATWFRVASRTYTDATYQQLSKMTTLTGSGTGAATSINVTLPASATWVQVGAANAAAAGISYWTVSGTTLTIVYSVAPATGTNNLSYWVTYK